MIDCVTLQLLYDESVTTERETLEVAEKHYYEYMLPTIQRVLDEFEYQKGCIEEIDIDLNQLAPEDIPYRLETMLREAIERNLSRPTIKGNSKFRDEELHQFPIQKDKPYKRNSFEDKQNPSFSNDYKETSNCFQDIQTGHATPLQKQLLLDFLFMEQIPWNAEPDTFDVAQWWNSQALSMLDDIGFVRSLYYICKDSSALYRLLTYSNDELMRKALTHWIVDDELLPSTNNIKSVLQSQGSLLDIKRFLSRMNAQSSSLLRLLMLAVVRDNQISNREFIDTVITHLYNIEDNRKVNSSQTSELTHITETMHATDLSQTTSRNDYDFPNNHMSLMKKMTQATIESQTPELIQANKQMLTAEAIKIEEQQMNFLQEEAYSSYTSNDNHYTSSNSQKDIEIQQIIYDNLEMNEATLSMRYTTDVAGLVLIHPFIINFFRRVHLLNEQNQFSNLYQRVHAVHLLRYLTGKQERHQSHLMNMEKILCGLSPKFPITEKYEISDEEKIEIHDIYEALKQYWKTVSNTSTEGIQQTFIHRTGIITYENPYWVLRVENSALDILMNDIPWELSMLMLPWSERSIWIEWQRDN